MDPGRQESFTQAGPRSKVCSATELVWAECRTETPSGGPPPDLTGHLPVGLPSSSCHSAVGPFLGLCHLTMRL